MKKSSALDKLSLLGQSQITSHWDSMNVALQEQLLDQIDRLNPKVFLQQRKLLAGSSCENTGQSFDPFEDYEEVGSVENIFLGKSKIAQGAVGAIVLAGGQGTRLGFNGPKGLFPLIGKKTLFEILCEKIMTASKEAARPLKLAIMTSPLNDKQTREYFEKCHFFGLAEGQVSFFVQGTLPFLNQSGDLFLDKTYRIAEGPDGNGGVFTQFFQSEIADTWEKQGIEDVVIIPVDNPLANPYDPELVGFHAKKRAEISAKCVFKKSESEKVGVFVRKNDHVFIKEYSELSVEEKNARMHDGHLKHRCANTGILCFSMHFMRQLADKIDDLPFHKAFKMAKDQNGSNLEMAWKFERFIFDCFPFAKKVSALVAPRELCFAPLKNLEGEDSLATVQAAFLRSEERG